MASFFYYARRLVAIVLGLALTGYSAWVSWTHSHDVLGPLAAIAAAVLLALCERAWHDRQPIRLGLLGSLGIAAAVFSASMVLERVASTSEARTHQARSSNLPRAEARKALDEARADLKTAEVAVRDETRKGGCRAVCEGLKKDAEAARARVDKARADLVALGATSAENPAATLLGPFAEMVQTATILGLPIWLEIAAPVVLACGFAPAPRKEEPRPKTKAKRQRTKREPRKPAKQDGVTDWVEAYRQKHGRAPKVVDVRQAFGVSRRPHGGASVPPPETYKPPEPCGSGGFSFCPFQDVSSVPTAWNFRVKSTGYGIELKRCARSISQVVETPTAPVVERGSTISGHNSMLEDVLDARFQ